MQDCNKRSQELHDAQTSTILNINSTSIQMETKTWKYVHKFDEKPCVDPTKKTLESFWVCSSTKRIRSVPVYKNVGRNMYKSVMM
jgi:hypothetical protein